MPVAIYVRAIESATALNDPERVKQVAKLFFKNHSGKKATEGLSPKLLNRLKSIYNEEQTEKAL